LQPEKREVKSWGPTQKKIKLNFAETLADLGPGCIDIAPPLQVHIVPAK